MRWGLILLVTIVGLATAAAPFALAWRVDDRFGDWQPLASGTLTNVGTTLLLVAAIWFLERKFTAHIRSAVQETTREVVTKETRGLVASQQDLSFRLDELQARLGERVVQEKREQDEVIERLSDDISFERVRAALALADSLGALWFHEVTIPAGDGRPEQPRFTFRMSSTSTGRRFDDDEGRRPVIEIEYGSGSSVGSQVIVFWDSLKSPVDVLGEMRQSMIAAGFAEQVKQLDAVLFANLHDALREAVASRRADPGSWLKGALDEWINDEWAVTQYGLEHRGRHGMTSDEFPVDWDGRTNQAARMWQQPAPPDGIDPTMWDFVIRRARHRHRPGVRFGS